MISLHLAWRAFVGAVPLRSFNLSSSDATSLQRFFVVAPMPLVHNMPLIAFTCRPPCAPRHHNQPRCHFCSYCIRRLFLHSERGQASPQKLRRHGRQVLASKHLKGRRRRHVSEIVPKSRTDPQLNTEALFREPRQLDPAKILVSPLNRDGAPPNVQHVHLKILKCFVENGFDSTRPAHGICVQYKSDAGRRALIEHNRRFTQGNALLPPISEDAEYGSLACSHLNLAFQCIRSGLSSPAGILKDLVNDEGQLKDVVQHGHKWWVLPETVLDEKQLDISLWRNMDQNENQTTHEIEDLQSIKVTCQTMSKNHAKITQGGLCAATSTLSGKEL